MRPNPNSDTVEIPMTFDVASGISTITERKIKLGFLIIVASIVVFAVLGVLMGTVAGFIFCAVVWFIAFTLFRIIFFNELYYKEKYAELKSKGFLYDTSVIWDIYEIAPGFPVCSFKNGSKAVFVTFDKDIIVGKPDNNEYLHYEAIADAYQMMSKKNIECMHLDYMDTVGKDTRLEPVVRQLLKTPNKELRQLLSVVFEYQQYTMSKNYSSYDVFAFYYKYNDDEFRDDLESIIACFMQANYIRYRLLGISQIRELAMSLYNLPDFSVYGACSNVFKTQNTSKFIRIIYTERDGERTIVNRTTEELEEAKRKREEQIAASKRKNKPAPQQQEQAAIDIFADMVEDTEDYRADDDFIFLDDDDILKSFESAPTNTPSRATEYAVSGYSEPEYTPEDIDVFATASDNTPISNKTQQEDEDEGMDLFGSEESDEDIDLFG